MAVELKEVLVIDDDPLIHAICEAFFRSKFHCPILSATTGAEALEIVGEQQRKLSLILCDLKMPDVDGVQFLRQIKEIDSKIPVIIISGEADRIIALAESIAVSHEINIICSLKKPLDLKKLELIVSNIEAPTHKNTEETELTSGIELAEAIRKKQLVAYYQPKVEPQTHRIRGVEALARWQHPTEGLIYPNRFIPVAERLGFEFLDGIHQNIISQVFADAQSWRKLRLPIKISINLSVDLLNDLTLPDQMMRMTEIHELHPTDFVLEITESKFLESKADQKEVLIRLKMMGFELSIDDFGTGYSNIDLLMTYPFDELKIDQCFIRNALDDDEARAIVESSVSLAQRLKLRTVAEGIETQEQFKYIMSLGIDEIQGYFIERPMSKDIFDKWMFERKTEILEKDAV